ncbi:hypothetical protein WICPIJ_005557 [Wickerhamomyces pijperi]|uniref:Aminotransferase class I/classII large domain-containing protein n=1 Tax=Wickerhamomyces pijperi TaxID=599730 RepID=A0A9P8Q3B3_WICPI|nr:hypothetical protein WICPIJ_005557 [Wickerhamomyces pijperi]
MPESTADPILSLLADRIVNQKVVSFHGEPVPKDIKAHPKPIHLSVGTPHHGFFPINGVNLDITLEPFGETTETVKVNKVANDATKELDIKAAFQYGPTQGHPQLLNFTKELIAEVNPPKYKDWDVTCTNGTGDSFNKVFGVIVNPGDVVLMEAYTYLPVCNYITNHGGITVPVVMNHTSQENPGIDVDSLTELLENWETHHPQLRRPKALYTIPTGQNPTGLTISQFNRAAIYNLAKLHNFLIVEDDPYGYIQLNDRVLKEEITPYQYVNELLPSSYIQYDTTGHVIRLESFSKTFAPGTRLGFVVGSSKIIKHMVKFADITSRAPSGISQVVVNQFIQAVGGVEGWINWNINVSKEYARRNIVLIETLQKSEAFKKGYMKVIEPDAGMFAIVELNFPPNEQEDYRSELQQLRCRLLESGVVVTYGSNFGISEEYSKKAKFIRLTIAAADDSSEIEEGMKRLGEGILKHFEQ